MATSGNGLKFVWMPGKKKHNRKGEYKTTKNQHNPYKASNLGGTQGQKKNEVWSMGGSRGQRSVINTDSSDFFTASASTSEAAVAVVANGAAIAATSNAVANEKNDLLTECLDDKQQHANDDDNNVPLKNGDCECDDDKEDMKDLDKSYHNTSTLVLGEKHKKLNASDDLDSIEQLGDSKSDLSGHNLDEIDVTDTASTHNLHTRKRRRNKSKRKKSKHSDQTRPEDDKLIACLYYSLVCCDCTIS